MKTKFFEKLFRKFKSAVINYCFDTKQTVIKNKEKAAALKHS